MDAAAAGLHLCGVSVINWLLSRKHLRAQVRTGLMSPVQEPDAYVSVDKQDIGISLYVSRW